jgi:hypothetical protein
MAKKVLIHTQKALPNEDFIADIQLPLNAKMVNGILVNAYDREKGVTVAWGYDILQPSYTIAKFLADNKGLPEFLGRDVLTAGATIEATEAKRDLYVDAIINAYIQSALAKETDPENQTIFNLAYYNAKVATFKAFVIGGFFPAQGMRNKWYSTLGVDKRTTLDGIVSYETEEPLRVIGTKKAWAVNDLKAWYNNFASYMSSNPAATTPDYLETFFNEASNFAPETYEQAQVYVKVQVSGGRDGSSTGKTLVNAYTYFGNKYGYPDATWFRYVPVESANFSFDAYQTAEIALNWFFEHVKYQISGRWWKDINWDKTNVGELSVLFNSGRDIAIRDMPMDLNNNSKSVHYDLMALSQKEQVNSFVRLVFKNNGKAVNPFYVKTYFFYETV